MASSTTTSKGTNDNAGKLDPSDPRLLIPSKKTVQQYISRKKLDDFFIELTENVLVDMPDNPVRFLVDYLYRAYPHQANNSSFAATFASGDQRGGGVILTGLAKDSGIMKRDAIEDGMQSEDDENFSDGILEEKEGVHPRSSFLTVSPATPCSRGSRRRSAVLCPITKVETPINRMNLNHTKQTEKEKKQLCDMLRHATILSKLGCPNSVFEELVEVMTPLELEVGKDIVNQGSIAPGLIAITQGKCSVQRQLSTEEEEAGVPEPRVLECLEGSCFAELNLLYDSPSPATLTTKMLVKAWVLTREKYTRILAEYESRRSAEVIKLLEVVPILQTLEELELRKLADVMEYVEYKEGDRLIQQNEKSKYFYIVKQGTVAVTQQVSPSSPALRVTTLGPGNQFGEIALLSDRPRAATVTADSDDVVCLRISRGAFCRLFGSLIDVLKRDMAYYREFISDKI